MIVFRYENNDNNMIKVAGEFLKSEMKISEEELLKVSIKQAFRLGKNSSAPLIIKFGNPGERNFILSHSKNIKNSKISVEKDIPKNYQKQHKVFKEEAFKLRNMPGMEYQTQIMFDNHFMRLMVKAKDTVDEKFHYVVHSSWKPPMENISENKSSMRTPTGTKATRVPDPTLVERANASVFLTLKGMTKEHTEDTFKNNLDEYLKDEHKNLVVEVKKANKRNDLLIIYCKDWNASNMIASSYSKKFMDHEVSFALFSKTNPDKMQI